MQMCHSCLMHLICRFLMTHEGPILQMAFIVKQSNALSLKFGKRGYAESFFHAIRKSWLSAQDMVLNLSMMCSSLFRENGSFCYCCGIL